MDPIDIKKILAKAADAKEMVRAGEHLEQLIARLARVNHTLQNWDDSLREVLNNKGPLRIQAGQVDEWRCDEALPTKYIPVILAGVADCLQAELAIAKSEFEAAKVRYEKA